MARYLSGILLIIFLWPLRAGASGFYMTNFGGSGASAVSSGAEATFWNPAGVINGRNVEVLLDYTQFLVNMKYKRNFIYKFDESTQKWITETADNLPEDTLLNFPPLPFVGTVWRINKKIAAGLGIYTPFGSSTRWSDKNGYQKYHSISGSILTVYVSPTFALRVTPWLDAGISISYVRAAIEAEKYQSFADVVGGLPEDSSLDALLKMHTFAGNGWNAAFGFMIHPQPTWKMGISYTFPLELSLKGTIEIQPLGEKALALFSGASAYAEGTLKTTFPQTLRLAAEWNISGVHFLTGAFEYVNWRAFDGFRFHFDRRTSPFVPEEMEEEKAFFDAYTVRIIYRNNNPHWPFFGGAGFESNASSNLTQAADMPDYHKVLLMGGLNKHLPHGFQIQFDLLGAIFIPRTVNTSVLVPPANGDYSGFAVLAHVSLRWSEGGEL